MGAIPPTIEIVGILAPTMVSGKVADLEKKEILHPKMEQRNKAILLKTLEKDAVRMAADGSVMEIDVEAAQEV